MVLFPLAWVVLAAASATKPSPAIPPSIPVEATTTPASTAAPAPASASDAALAGSSTYTVKKGESIWDVSHKCHCSVTAIKKLNHLKTNRLKTGQVIEVPAGKTGAVLPIVSAPKTAAKTKTPKISKTIRRAQPVQDFDIPASTFASCPTPPGEGGVSEATIPVPIRKISLSSTSMFVGPPVPPLVRNHPAPLPVPSPTATPIVAANASARTSALPPAPAKPQSSKNLGDALADFFGGNKRASEAGEWGNRFLTETRSLAERGIGYNQSWRPEGESHKWAMDCSNTTRYLYQVAAGIQLPRTASDQYYYLHLQNKAWDVPTVANGFADCNFLRANLKPGDLLFWENTYRPDREPPITHVMIFLGTNARGQWIMAGSQSGRGGQFNRHRSGPDVYVFDPTHSTGGYTTWLGLVHHKGRFCAYGRPLEADVKKLSVAANN